ncbi:MAG: hypothetical protein C0417_08580 [Chlorobiaceae bacterium]|nr:hypothetical protein [Chlorobiaceae bacterium]
MFQQILTVTRSGKVLLTLPNKEYKSRRHIGDVIENTLHVKRDPTRHFFNRFNGYGFCYELMRDGSFERVVVHLPFGKTLVTTRKHILAKGKILNFQKNKLEKQIYLSLDDYGLDKARESEMNSIPTKLIDPQLSIFGGIQ